MKYDVLVQVEARAPHAPSWGAPSVTERRTGAHLPATWEANERNVDRNSDNVIGAVKVVIGGYEWWVHPAACLEPGTSGGLFDFARVLRREEEDYQPCTDCDGTGSTCGGHWSCSTCKATGRVPREDA